MNRVRGMEREMVEGGRGVERRGGWGGNKGGKVRERRRKGRSD